MVEKMNVDSQTALGKIRARDRVQPTYGFANLALIAKHNVEAKNASLGDIKKVYEGNGWECGEQDFSRKYSKTVAALKM